MCSQLYNLRVNRLNVLCYFIIQSDLWLNNITNTAMTSTVHGLMFGSVTFITGGMLASNFARGWGGGGGKWGKKFHTGLHPDFLVCYVVDWPNTYMFIYFACHNNNITKEYSQSIVCCIHVPQRTVSCVSSQFSSEEFLRCTITVTIQLRQK